MAFVASAWAKEIWLTSFLVAQVGLGIVDAVLAGAVPEGAGGGPEASGAWTSICSDQRSIRE